MLTTDSSGGACYTSDTSRLPVIKLTVPTRVNSVESSGYAGMTSMKWRKRFDLFWPPRYIASRGSLLNVPYPVEGTPDNRTTHK